MKYDIKTSIIFTGIVILGFSILSSLSFLYYKNVLRDSLIRESRAYYELKKREPLYPAPHYLVLSDRILFHDGLVPLIKLQDTYIYVKKDYLQRKFNMFFLNFFLWNTAIIFSLYIFFHFTILRYIKKETNIKRTLEIFTLAISHKLGNFLSVNKINIELLKTKCNSKELSRIEQSYNLLEKDFFHISDFLKNLESDRKRVLNIKTIVEKHLRDFQKVFPEKKLILSMRDLYVKTEEKKLNIVLLNLFENAFKYSDRFVHIKMCKTGKDILLIIRNDIGIPTTRSTGIGLEIVKNVIGSLNGSIVTRIGKKTFTVFLNIKL